MADEVAAHVAESTQPAPAPVAPAPTAGADPAASTEAPTPEAKPPEEKKFGQADVDRMIQKRLAKEARRLEREITERVQREHRTPEPTKPAQSDAPGKPVLKDFPDYESWVEAVADWRAEQKIEARIKAEAEKTQKAHEERTRAERARYFQERVVEKGSELYEDFEDVVLNEKLTITDAMAKAFAEMDQGPVVAYYLGEHPDEAARIAGLSDYAQMRELDKIAATLTKPAAPTKAPEPIKPNRGDGSVSDTLESAASDYQKWLKIRNRQLGRNV